jgi:hypothetical protein
MYPFFEWLQSISFLTALRESALAYPIVMTGHLTGMALFGGMILMTDMRLLGLSLTRYKISDVVEGLRPWKHLGGLLTMGCGLFLFSSEALKYYPNPYFWLKMTLLFLVFVHAMVFRGPVYNKAKEMDEMPVIPRQAKVAAVLSLILWTGLVSSGRLIGYWEAPKTEQAAAAIR